MMAATGFPGRARQANGEALADAEGPEIPVARVKARPGRTA